jgi:hypothetical protein
MIQIDDAICDSLGLHASDMPMNVFTDWASLKEAGYDTKANYKFDHLMVLKPKEKCRAVLLEEAVFTMNEWAEEKRRLAARSHELSDRPDQLERFCQFQKGLVPRRVDDKVVVDIKRIPVYHESQMQGGKFRPRTKAFIEFGNIFWRRSNRTNYIKRNPDPDGKPKWFTKDHDQRKFELQPLVYMNEGMLRDHINQRDIYGVRADHATPQRWVAADFDLHIDKGDRPDIFMRQVEALLTYLHSKQWIVCLPRGAITGIHVVKIFDKPRRWQLVREEIEAMLRHLAELHPVLDQEAAAVGMKTFAAKEIYPNPKNGFRLPLGRGYTAITNRLLDLVPYHKYRGVALKGGDVEAFVNWDGVEMPLDQQLAIIRERVPKDAGDQLRIARVATKAQVAGDRKAIEAVAKEVGDKKLLGSMKGRYTKVLVEFYSGRLQVPKALQRGILLGVGALWAQKYPLDQRGDYLLDLLQEIEIVNPIFSSRLSNSEWESIAEDIYHTIAAQEKLRSDPNAGELIQRSNGILLRWAKAMSVLGFNFGDKRTWSDISAKKVDFAFDDSDIELINAAIVPVFQCSEDTAKDAVEQVIRVVATKARHGDGLSREYRRALLTDNGISCQENSKLARCWDILVDTGFLRLTQAGVFRRGHRDGKANSYAIGPRLISRVYGFEPAVLPLWLSEAMTQDGQAKNWIDADESAKGEIIEVEGGNEKEMSTSHTLQ